MLFGYVIILSRSSIYLILTLFSYPNHFPKSVSVSTKISSLQNGESINHAHCSQRTSFVLCPKFKCLCLVFHTLRMDLTLLHGPVYINIIKNFWKKACVSEDNLSIHSNFHGIPVTITEASIAETTGCPVKPNIACQARFDHYNAFEAPYNLSKYHCRALNNPFCLSKTRKVFFRLSFLNLQPRSNFHKYLYNIDHLLCRCLEKGRPLNVPSIIFTHMRELLLAYKCSQNFFVPYGRVLSTLFQIVRVLEILCNANFDDKEEVLYNEACEPFSFLPGHMMLIFSF